MMVRVSAPATVANLGPGFDAMGMAVGVHCIFEARSSGNGDGITICAHGVDGEKILDGQDNLVVKAMRAVESGSGHSLPPITIDILNQIPLARGMGSSAAAIVGGAVLANEILGRPLSADQLLDIAAAIEGHPDNVAPALMGGLVASSKVDGRVISIKAPISVGRRIKVVIAVPAFEIRTEDARRILPAQVPLGDAVFNVSRTAILISALSSGKLDLLKPAMEDRLHQPYRSKLVPGLEDVFASAIAAGALGVALAGSGPSVVALATQAEEKIAFNMVQAFQRHGISAISFITTIETRGARVLNVADLELAKSLLSERQLGLIFVKDGSVIFESRGSGVKPVLDAFMQIGTDLEGSSCADKVLGRASGAVLRSAGVDQVFARVAREKALHELQVSGIYAEAGEIVDIVLNRDRSGPCPFELMVGDETDPDRILEMLKERLGYSAKRDDDVEGKE
ncbi:MAG: homoserine kinase [Firmicutes bacterium]|nr:homoserine kinase [Bacillota bacterium]